MKAISVMQPWAWAILHAGKRIENRTWALPAPARRHWHWLHTGKNTDEPDAWEMIAEVTGGMPPPRKELPLGAIVGAVYLTGDVTRSDSPWFGGPHGWTVGAVRQLTCDPIRCRGQLGFWEPSEMDGVDWREVLE